MSLEKAFLELQLRQQRLIESLASLRLAVAEDKPLRPDIALVDQRCAVVDDLLGWAEEARSAGVEGVAASQRPIDLDAARAALIKSQEAFNSLAHSLTENLVSYGAMAELAAIGLERGRDWKAWVAGVSSALRDCRQLVYEVNEALFGCWREMSERAGMNSVNVKTTAIGQKITVPRPKRLAREERT
jgi:hypothetical protein